MEQAEQAEVVEVAEQSSEVADVANAEAAQVELSAAAEVVEQESDNKSPEGWAPGAYTRFKETNSENKKLKEQLAEYQSREVPDVANIRAEYESKLAQMQEDHSYNLAFTKLGSNFEHPSVQRAIKNEYSDYTSSFEKSEENPEPASFEAWVRNPATAENPLIGRFLSNLESQGQQQAQQTQQVHKVESPKLASGYNAETQNIYHGQVTADQVRQMSSSQRKAFLDQLAKDGKIKRRSRR